MNLPTDSNEPIIVLEDVNVRYRVPIERVATIKEFSVRWLKGGLSYRELWALKNVSLSIVRGETFGIIGANGAGKSTLLKLISRVLRPSSGRVRVFGTVAPLLDLGAGFDPELTGRENIFLNGTLLGRKKAHLDARLDHIVRFGGLEAFVDMPVRMYSSGMLVRLGFSIAADVQTDVLLIDEVLSVGDAQFQKKSADQIETIRATGACVVIVSHDLEALSRLAHRVAWLHDGGIRAVGPADEIIGLYRGQ